MGRPDRADADRRGLLLLHLQPFIVQSSDLPERAFQLLNVMFGALSLAFGQVCNYGWARQLARSGQGTRCARLRSILPSDSLSPPSRRLHSVLSANDAMNMASNLAACAVAEVLKLIRKSGVRLAERSSMLFSGGLHMPA